MWKLLCFGVALMSTLTNAEKYRNKQFTVHVLDKEYVIVMTRQVHQNEANQYCDEHFNMHLATVPDQETIEALHRNFKHIQGNHDYPFKDISTAERTDVREHQPVRTPQDLNPQGQFCVIISNWTATTRNYTGDFTLKSKKCDAERTFLCEEKPEQDPCESNPCRHGSCTSNSQSFQCICEQGYTGNTCNEVVDPCRSNPCRHGSCTSNVQSQTFQCTCQQGYTGRTCDEVVDPCSSNPCRHGSCTSNSQSQTFQCTCQQGYTGRTCNEVADPCASNPCRHGTCTSDSRSQTFQCMCQAGYLGRTCNEVDRCHSRPCGEHADCTNNGATYSCSCHEGWTGSSCSVAKDVCAGNPCGANGICDDQVWRRISVFEYLCSCFPGYTGKHCETAADPCDGKDCNGNGYCLSMTTTYRCFCQDGFTGTDCEDAVGQCDPNPCGTGSCHEIPDSYVCICPDNRMLQEQSCSPETQPPPPSATKPAVTATDCSTYTGRTSGLHNVLIDGKSSQVYCEKVDGEIWTVIQRRVDSSVRFDRTFEEYEDSFGDPAGNFWIGLKTMHLLTKDRPVMLRIDLKKFNGQTAYAVYSSFSIGPGPDYSISVSGFSGSTSDQIDTPWHSINHMPFSTKDKPTSPWKNCAQTMGGDGGWWYSPTGCTVSNLNGRYHSSSQRYSKVNTIQWASFTHTESLKEVSMKIKSK